MLLQHLVHTPLAVLLLALKRCLELCHLYLEAASCLLMTGLLILKLA